MTEFVQQEPIEGGVPSEKTDVRVLVDRQNLYIGIINFDTDPSGIVLTQSKRDGDLGDSDSVQIILDTFNDRQNGFVFGTNPTGIEYDGQVAGEGQTSGSTGRPGSGGSQGGSISGFNVNWDADWTVRSQITERGWETEISIPLRTLRYATGANKTWGFNVMRNIRRRNEQVYLARIPRGYTLNLVSQAAKLTGLNLSERRDIKMIPYVLGSADKNFLSAVNSLDRTGDVGVDLKWGMRPNLTADFTINTDFAQVEADEQQVNLTRFPQFFPEKRPFFLENAATFQFGTPQQVDLFFSRRIGLDRSGVPIGIIGGARLSGKVGGFNVGALNMQTEKTLGRFTGTLVAPANNFSALRVQREVGRSNFGGIFVGRVGTGNAANPDGDYNRAYGLDANIQVTQNSKLFTYIARTDSASLSFGSDYAGRALYQFTNNLYSLSGGFTQVGERFNPEVGFLSRRGYRRPETRATWNLRPGWIKKTPWLRQIFPHYSYNGEYGFEGETQSSRQHIHPLEFLLTNGGRFGTFWEVIQDHPTTNFAIHQPADGANVVVPPGLYTWFQHNYQFISDPTAPVFFSGTYNVGGFYDGNTHGPNFTVGYRAGSKFLTTVGISRDNITLPGGNFSTTLVPTRISYSFTPLASIQALIQYNTQVSQLSSNIRLALLDRSGTGFFVVYNDRQDTTSYTAAEALGRSFIVKYTRLFDM
ncbi:MAG: hydrolase [Luteitalea sp.]|nr:hydrolase [Luteitalea sp.]